MPSDKETAAVGQPTDHQEAARRLPSIHLIDPYRSLDVLEETARLTCRAPAWFWTKPATTSDKYHHPIAREERGLWVHTLLLARPLERQLGSMIEQGRLTEREADYARAAAVLHDQRKHGHSDEPTKYATDEHAVEMADVIREESSLPEPVAAAVESHMGPFERYDGPDPETELEKVVHAVDMEASDPFGASTVPAPIPEELVGMGLREVEL